jgi:hypothetical protein
LAWPFCWSSLTARLMAYRSVQLLCTIDPASRPALPALMRIFFVSTFLGTFLPASIGGDAVRAYSLSRLHTSAAATPSPRCSWIACWASPRFLIMAFAGLLLAPNRSSAWLVGLSMVAAGGACRRDDGARVQFNGRARGRRWPSFDCRTRSKRSDSRLVVSIRRYAAHHATLAYVLVGSVWVHGPSDPAGVLPRLALGLGLPVSAYFAFIPLILLFMLLPITFNGIGTSQLAFDWFFVGAGVAPATVFALSVLFIALGVIGNLPGGLLYVFDGGARVADTKTGKGRACTPQTDAARVAAGRRFRLSFPPTMRARTSSRRSRMSRPRSRRLESRTRDPGDRRRQLRQHCGPLVTASLPRFPGVRLLINGTQHGIRLVVSPWRRSAPRSKNIVMVHGDQCLGPRGRLSEFFSQVRPVRM